MKLLCSLFTPSEQKVLFFLVFFGVLGLVYHREPYVSQLTAADSLSTPKLETGTGKVNLLTASRTELIAVEGIGPKRANDIFLYREKYGFKKLEDLKNVRGIGEKTYAIISRYLEIPEEREAAKKEMVKELPKRKNAKKLINLNTATEEELCSLPGIGTVKAQRIIAFRIKYQRFKSIEQLKEIYSIGDKTYEQIKDYVTVGDNDARK